MARITLKLTKPIDPSAPPRARTSRAWRAGQGKPPPKAATAVPAAAPARFAGPATIPEANPPAAPASSRSKPRRGKPPGAAKAPKGAGSGPAGAAKRRRDTSGAVPPAVSTDRTRRSFEQRTKRNVVAHGTPVSGGAAAPASGARPTRAKPLASSPAPPQQGSTPAPALPRTPRHDNPGDPRLSKRMSELGLCSRREADEWIENGWVTVDGKVVDTLGTRVSPRARIEIDPAASKHQGEQVTILLHKPIGYVSGQAEDGYQPASVLIRPENRWADDPSPTRFKPSHLRGLAPAGRLDVDSTGLLVFTQDGRIAKQLIGRDSAIEKEYLVRVEGTLSGEAMRLLQHGLELDGVKLRPARVSWQNEDQLRFVLREGRKRQIRRMCELVGLVVTGLKRVRSGSVPLGRLPVGQWRYLRRDETF